MLVLFSTYGLAFWYGGKLVTDPEKDYTIGRVMVVFFGVLTGAFSLSAVGQNLEYFGSARAAAYTVFQIIDRIPTIDVFSNDGLKPKNMKGSIKLKNVYFTYPAREDQQVLKNVSFEAHEGRVLNCLFHLINIFLSVIPLNFFFHGQSQNVCEKGTF